MGSGYPIIYGECGSGQRRSSFTVTMTCSRWANSQAGARDRLPQRSSTVSCTRAVRQQQADLIAMRTQAAVAKFIKKTFGKLPVTPGFIVEGEDGLAVPSLYRFTSEHAEMLRADGCIWDEGSRDTKENPIVSLGFKGITFLELRAFGARSICTQSGARSFRISAWRLVQALATITSPKGVITIDGFSSHIAPISDEDAEVLKAIELDEADWKKEFRIGGWVRAMKGPALVKGNHIFGPTCTICGIHTGSHRSRARRQFCRVWRWRVSISGWCRI